MNLIELFLKILKFKSITPHDDGAFEFFKEYLKGFEIIEVGKEGVKNLFMYKKFGEGIHLCFAGHIDVVPAGDGWENDAFEPVLKDGYIHARGSQDMKSGVCAFLKALKDTENFNGTLSMLLTSDEEGDATYGTVIMLEHLKQINFLPDFAIVAEPTCEKYFGDSIKIGRRGSINGVLKLFGKQGHAAYPEKSKNPIHLIAPILPNIAGINLDSGDENFSASKFVITDIRAGIEVTNVTPGVLKMMFNVRNSTKTTKDDIQKLIDTNFAGLDYELTLNQGAKPFLTNPNSKNVQKLIDSIQRVCEISPKLSTSGGTSDARFVADFGVEVVEFGVRNDTIHAPNERVFIGDVEELYSVFKDFIENM
ncbi:MAG: succinyl-diaminopimelate desuccinylase [Campylobacterales bacterium]|nr:succinyl-diaminopimelate desuccinylase [Campylobacterales bacterium]